ncbi:hypothetical protein R69658_05438 [Paraburkholderia aspalathi]|uniref:Uncharacterized protein n=1 Tax=Paraburkholderia aspalathi TaxID=1324617 RepID=A0ABM8SI68_9BURK|nr:hypothetical protein [Paraburkholderia aspalathi]MBK3821812.1 hypothetical protein [Paraburkholderia aspalathi]MBK3833584.1 hypothetical protein [Paraburkholderia aspalathi]MBK3863307.1 hypothetical protein [Paraburkholderia aspalathi]CAE6811774.1 hypothetical protein R69658_05438 [Paraburkholderia aspalathi]
MSETQSKLWFSGVAFIPYAVLAYGFNWLTKGSEHDLTITITVFLGGRLVYGLIDNVTAATVWRLHGRKRAVEAFLKLMRENRMPRRESPAHSLGSYLSYVDSDCESNAVIRSAARQISTVIEQSHHYGLMGGNRVEKAAQEAYERYQDGLSTFRLPDWIETE